MSEMATYGIVPKTIDMKPKRHHGYAVILFIMGTLFPPLAVAARFGIGKDFWLNLLLTICGYIPGHGHNFYIQNIRNNKNHARTPKWVQKYGLVDLSEIKRKERKSQWATRYNDRLPASALEGQPYAEGQEAGSSVDLASIDNGKPKRQPNGDLWRPEDESYYNADNASTASSSRWHYPANFDDAVLDSSSAKRSKSKKKKEKKNRWERTQDAYSAPAEEESGRKKKSKKKKRRSSDATDSIDTHDESTQEFPEDAEGGLYGNTSEVNQADKESTKAVKTTEDTVFNHQF